MFVEFFNVEVEVWSIDIPNDLKVGILFSHDLSTNDTLSYMKYLLYLDSPTKHSLQVQKRTCGRLASPKEEVCKIRKCRRGSVQDYKVQVNNI